MSTESGSPIPITFDDRLHAAGEQHPVASYAMRQALAWWVAAELIRRHPTHVRVRESCYPYDCLSLQRRSSTQWQLVALLGQDLGHHITPLNWGDSERFNWTEVLLAPDRRAYVVAQLELLEGLIPPASTPPTTATSIGPRLIAAFMGRSAL